LSLTPCKSSILTATVSPSNATNKVVSWSSSSTSVATVDTNGIVTAVSEGTAVITVTTQDGGKTATCQVTVTNSSVTYCIPVVNTNYQWISQVSTGSISNTTGNNNGYGDFTNLSTNMEIGSAQSITLVTGWATSSSAWRVWIDFNHDGDFTDSGEEVISTDLIYPDNTTSFTIPSTATPETTRMRVMMKNSTVAYTPCQLNDGEVEDYTVNIVTNSMKSAETMETGVTQKIGQDIEYMNIYPNPAGNNLSVEISGQSNILSAKVFDMTGNVTHTWDSPEGTLDISSLNSGMYILEVKTEKGEWNKKFVKK
jgi:hypothetical protein